MTVGLIHTGLLFGSLLIAWLVGWASLALLRSSRAWGDRRSIQLLCLGAPLLVMGILGVATAVMIVRGCHLFTLPDTILSFLMLAAGGAILLVAFGSTVWRTLNARRLLGKIAEPWVDSRVQAILMHLAPRLGVPMPELARCDSEYPLACVTGLRKPTIVLSSWMLEHLDDGELEAVLAHELAHLRHHDNLIAWVTTWLKEGLFYLPTTRRAWAQIQADREVLSDSWAVRATGKPMALASALAKVWQQGLLVAQQRPPYSEGLVAGFSGETEVSLESRIQRLLDDRLASSSAPFFGPRTVLALVTAVLLAALALLPLYLMPSGTGTSCLLMAM